jgi:ankyrin repeat protein
MQVIIVINNLPLTFIGADPNIPYKDGRTPLHVAAFKNLFYIAEALVRAGANVNTKYREMTPAETAKDAGSKEVLKMLETLSGMIV